MSAPTRLRKAATGFTMVPNALIRDGRLSLKAKGLYSLLFSKPDNWQYFEDALLKESLDGRDAFRSGVKELTDCGWLIKKQVQDGGGKFSHTEWLLTVDGKPGDGSSGDGKPAPIDNTDGIKTKPSPLTPSGGMWEDDSSFMELVRAYTALNPDRVDLRKAWEAWTTGNLGNDAEAILKALPFFASGEQWRRDDGRFIPGLSKWLSERGWKGVAAGLPTPDAMKERERIGKAGLSAYARIETDKVAGRNPSAEDVEAVRRWRRQQANLSQTTAPRGFEG